MATVDAIKKLHTSMIDTFRAYEKAQSEAEEPALKALFAEMAAMRQKAHTELHHVLSDMGETPDEDGSFMTSVHKAAIAVRSAVTGIDRGALSSFASGEQNIVKEYDEALGQSDIFPDTSALLTRQKAELLVKIAKMDAMENDQ